jgi:hypothetical protein
MSKIIDYMTTFVGLGILGYFTWQVILPKVSELVKNMPQIAPQTEAPAAAAAPSAALEQPTKTPPPASTNTRSSPSSSSSTTKSPNTATGPGTSTQPTATGGGVTDAKGIRWIYADGDITTIAQSRTDTNDHRWSGNVSGLGKLGMEATMIVDFTGASVASGGHFAKKMSGGNHSGSGASGQKWYDFGIRANGAIQVQTEHPHPNNHTFACSDVGGCSVSNIGKGMKGSIIGLKWLCQPQGNGNFVALYYDANALTAGKPTNAWKKVFSIVDTKLLPGWKPPDTWDCEIRISDTSGEKPYGGGLHVRKLTKPISAGTASYARAFYSRQYYARPNYYNSRYPILNRYSYGRRL